MPFTSDDSAAIKLVREEKGSGAKRILREFPNKQWPRTTVRMVYQDSVTSFNDLKEKILHCWGKLNQGLIDSAIDQCETSSKPKEGTLSRCFTKFRVLKLVYMDT